MAVPVQSKGPFAQHAIPQPMVVKFRQPDGTTPVDLTGYDVVVVIEKPSSPDPTIVQRNSMTVGDGVSHNDAAGDVTVEFREGDFSEVGNTTVIVWVYNGAVKLHSDVVSYEITDVPGNAPVFA